MTGLEAIAALHALRAAGSVTSWRVHYAANIVAVHALIDPARYGRLTARAESVTYEASMLALVWALENMEREVAA